MHSALRLTSATAAIGLLAFAFVVGGLGIFATPAPAASHAGSTSAAHAAPLVPAHVVKAPAAPASVHPAAHASSVHPAASVTNVTVAWLTAFAANTSVPTDVVQFALNVTTGNLDNINTTLWIQVYDYTLGAWVTNISLNGSVGTTVTNGTGGPVSTGSVAGVEYAAATWNTSFNETTLGCTTTNCHDVLALHDEFNLTVQVKENGTGLGGSIGQNNSTASTNFVGAITSYSVKFDPSGPTVKLYSHIPFEVNYTLSVQNATIDPTNVSMYATITNALTGFQQSMFAVPTVTGVSSYSFWVNDANLSCASYDPTCQGITGSFHISVGISVSGYNAPTYGTIASGPNVVNTTDRLHLVSFLTVPLTAELLSPISPAASTGNITFSATYTGQFILSANITVYSPAQAGLAIFTANMLKSVSGIPASVVWDALSPGTYPYTLNVTTLYKAYVSQSYTITISTSGGGTTYVNSTAWQNKTNTGVLGLSAAGGGTLLLLVGLIVGLIVAMLLGRAVYARPPTAPAQQWEAKPAAAANTCSVCGKSFATPDELQAHSKSEHGM
jgi:hypothetical protein